MTTPVWQTPTSGSTPLTGHVNQFFVTHVTKNLYTATQKAAQTTAGVASTSTNGLFLAQSFTTAVGQTTVGYVSVPVSTTTTSGSNLSTTTLSLYASSGTAPTGSALVSTTLTAEYANLATAGTPTTFAIYPLPVSNLTASTTYWLVLAAAGTVSNSYTWYRSNQVSGASTSPDGVTWTAQAYGLEYAVFDQTVSGNLVSTWEDNGARWTTITYRTNGEINTFAEYTVGQTATGYLQSFRTLSYTSNALTGVA